MCKLINLCLFGLWVDMSGAAYTVYQWQFMVWVGWMLGHTSNQYLQDLNQTVTSQGEGQGTLQQKILFVINLVFVGATENQQNDSLYGNL